jgi:hypothetical protein
LKLAPGMSRNSSGLSLKGPRHDTEFWGMWSVSHDAHGWCDWTEEFLAGSRRLKMTVWGAGARPRRTMSSGNSEKLGFSSLCNVCVQGWGDMEHGQPGTLESLFSLHYRESEIHG